MKYITSLSGRSSGSGMLSSVPQCSLLALMLTIVSCLFFFRYFFFHFHFTQTSLVGPCSRRSQHPKDSSQLTHFNSTHIFFFSFLEYNRLDISRRDGRATRTEHRLRLSCVLRFFSTLFFFFFPRRESFFRLLREWEREVSLAGGSGSSTSGSEAKSAELRSRNSTLKCFKTYRCVVVVFAKIIVIVINGAKNPTTVNSGRNGNVERSNSLAAMLSWKSSSSARVLVRWASSKKRAVDSSVSVSTFFNHSTAARTTMTMMISIANSLPILFFPLKFILFFPVALRCCCCAPFFIYTSLLFCAARIYTFFCEFCVLAYCGAVYNIPVCSNKPRRQRQFGWKKERNINFMYGKIYMSHTTRSDPRPASARSCASSESPQKISYE